jgi:hypothetical protein
MLGVGCRPASAPSRRSGRRNRSGRRPAAGPSPSHAGRHRSARPAPAGADAASGAADSNDRTDTTTSGVPPHPQQASGADQRCAVAGETLKQAACFSEQPSSIARTSARRPANPSLALACRYTRPSFERESWQTHSLKGGPDRTPQPFELRNVPRAPPMSTGHR